jgi:AraC family transcriptional regulator, positive regulator of tynA and feaB
VDLQAARLEHQRWSTADVDPRRALAYWIETICQSFLEIDIDSSTRNGFRARLDQVEFGPATLNIVEADVQTVRRTRAHIARSNFDTFFLLQLRSGRAQLSQYGRESQLEIGDCVLIDCKEPYDIDCSPATRSVALRFRQDWLKTWIPCPENVCGHKFASGAGWGAALSTALANLDAGGADRLALPKGVVAEHIAVLLALAAGPNAEAARSTDKLLQRILGTMRDRCHEWDLTPAAVAEAHGISKRYLHYLFAQGNSTFGTELMRLRLDGARRLLSDQRFGGVSVGEVSSRCGFVEPSHFARRFRKAFGQGPMQFRSKCTLRVRRGTKD